MERYDIGIIGAMDKEVDELISRLDCRQSVEFGSVTFHTGSMFGKRVVVARCGIGKVFAALCAEAMIVRFAPRLLVNTGVGGAIGAGLSPMDIVVADKLVQHDMDTSPLGDPKGLISGINKIYFETDEVALSILSSSAFEKGIPLKRGTIASGDQFISDRVKKQEISETFSASVCEMEGAAIGHVCYINGVDFTVIRAISDNASGDADMEYPEMVRRAAAQSTEIIKKLLEA
jgi:adenosylhomocysteine nucleosidase